jgi:two-component system, OmpR family, osmolarity sensor histidine kinase EnvZ
VEPRTRRLRFGLAQRTMLLLVAVVFGSLAVLVAGFSMQRRDDFAEFADNHARGFAAQVHSARLMLEAVPEVYRRDVSESLRASGTVQVFPVDAIAPPRPAVPAESPPLNALARLFGTGRGVEPDVSEAVGRYATPPAEVRFTTEPGPRYWVSQVIDGEKWWIVVLAGEPPPASGGVPWSAVAAVLFGLLAVGALYASTITRPLRELVVATRRIGDSWPDPVPANGAAELRDLADSFNDMLVRLRQIEDERRVLLGGLPHDLRAPLTRLRLRLATLTELGEHPGIVDDISSIDHIVRQFTEYLRGVQPDEPREALDDIVRNAVDAYRSLGRNVQLEDAAVPRVDVPRFAVRRLLENLIENAVQHGQEPVLVRIAQPRAGTLELIVTDHGPGIPRETEGLAVEPFTKLDPARGRGGCGLGLAIVRQLSRQLGGGIRFEKQQNSFSVVASLGVK